MDLTDVCAASVKEALDHILNDAPDDPAPINLLDLDRIVQNYQRWTEQQHGTGLLPYYAPSVNNHPTVLALMARLGVGFSCASEEEMCTALSLGVPPGRIRFVHPVKTVESILFAKQHHIKRLVVDSETEIDKVYRHYPDGQLLLRIRLSREQKYGCCPRGDAPGILAHAKANGIQVAGLYVAIPAPNQHQVEALQRGLEQAKAVYEQACALGLTDIRELAVVGAETIPSSALARAIANLELPATISCVIETERQFVESAVTLVTSVQSKRIVRDPDQPEVIREIMYFINDGRYGSFEWWTTPVTKEPTVYRTNGARQSLPAQVWPSSVWGPTCDSADVVFEKVNLPELDIGDFLVFADVGAYGGTLASQFNGCPLPRMIACAHNSSTRALLGFEVTH
ncbi:ornithine decarboxylase 2-like [Anopheles darlingi]|uniref:ornithine decarboxylase 2-like n=1 Tax=Anopheles darlingi TaxID=43151 RepID=UPI0021005B96|nr:ornithine decarboxylase 2-like [Anopheles darlingi]